MHFFPIISTLARHRTTAVLIVLEIAVTCAIVCNAVFVLGERIHRMDTPSGIAEDELVVVGITGIGRREDAIAITNQDIAALHALPGVKHVAATNMIPFGNSSWNTGISTRAQDPDALNAAFYLGTPELLDTFGVDLVEGRTFELGEYVDFSALQKKTSSVSSVIITRELERRLFPNGSAIGQKVYIVGDVPQVVVGVVERLVRPNDFGKADQTQLSMILPVKVPYTTGGRYVLRVDPSRRDQVLAAVDSTLFGVDRARIILDRKPYSQIRAERFKQDRAMVWLLVGVSIALLAITALGIVGLASFWVQQRTRQIGIRRALGATRGDILRYFQAENFILATLGIVLGMALAYALNLWLMSKYQVPRLPATLLPTGAILLWVLGQLAVLGPALRASTIAPAIATRTV